MIEINIEVLVVIIALLSVILPIVVTSSRNKKKEKYTSDENKFTTFDDKLKKLEELTDKQDKQIIKFEGIVDKQISSCDLKREPMLISIQQNKVEIDSLRKQINELDRDLRIKIAKYETINSRK
jgi:SMC interacting uncharacterized protein involved in chromosome segregation